MNTKAKGTRREAQTIKTLEAQGYACTRAAASLGVWDIIAIRRDGIKLIQVKSNRWPGSVEMEGMIAFECPASCSKEVWRYDDGKPGKVRLI